MRRGLAVLVLLSVCSLQSQTFAFHVHAVSDAESNDDHRHGPAIHHHGDFDPTPHIGQKDAVGAVITLAVPVAETFTSVHLYAEFADALPELELLLVGDARAIEVRSHGPPRARRSVVRGPPSSTLL